MPRATDPAPARRAAFELLHRVESAGAWASILLDALPSTLDPRDRALTRRIVLGVLRTRSALDHAIDRCATRPTSRMDPGVRLALRIAAFEILELDRVPDHAAVDDAVRLARRAAGHGASGFVNAVGRALAVAGRDALPPAPRRGDVAALACAESHPIWWVERLVRRSGWDAAVELLAADNVEPPLVVRCNPRRIDARGLVDALEAAGLESEPGRVVPDARRIQAGAERLGPLLDAGLALPQDEASQLVGRIAAPRHGLVLDLCAAPGGKASQIAGGLEPGGVVVAADRHHGRLRRLDRLRRRLGLDNLSPVQAEITRGGVPFGVTFDHVLVDAPCSGSGTMRRHPEIRWRLGPDDPPRLARLQASLLDAAAALVRPGGRLVYAVCSLEPEEGESVAAGFLERHAGFRLSPAGEGLPSAAASMIDSRGMLRSSPGPDGLDGFFAASLVRGGGSG